MEKNLGIIWKERGLAEGQNHIVQQELTDLRNGKPHYSWKALAKALHTIPGENMPLVDIGCGGGYMVEVIGQLLPGKFIYTGADFSQHMLEIANRNYPNTEYKLLDIRNIDLTDSSYDVVLSCAVLVHVPEWQQAIKELCRISKKYVVLHNTPISANKYWSDTKLSYDGIEILFQRFNLEDIKKIINKMGFQELYKEKTNSDPNNIHYTLIFKRD